MQTLFKFKFELKSLFLTLVLTSTNIAQSTETLPNYLGAKVVKSYYDGKDNDLLTAGWTIEELAKRKLPMTGEYADLEWIRKIAYYKNVTALLDTTKLGGYGTLFGPKTNHDSVSGYEYISYSLDASNQIEATLMLQIPDNMVLDKPCIIVAASSGSRGIYGAVGTVGTWALEKRCAIAYTDKGTGTGFYFHDSKKGFDIRGRYRNSEFNPLLYSPSLNSSDDIFLKENPTAISIKHAYSKKNIEKDAGKFVIQAGEFALYQLNQHFKGKQNRFTFSKANTTIIAASVSNGAAASLKAGEQDLLGLFDGIVAAEPNITPIENEQLKITQGKREIIKHSIAGYEYFVAQNLFAPCTLLTEEAKQQPFYVPLPASITILQAWCDSLKTDGFIKGSTFSELANNALNKLTNIGIATNQQKLAPIAYAIKLWPSIATTYTNQTGRFNLGDNVCNVYFSALNNRKKPIHMNKINRLGLFSNSNGIPPTGGVSLVSSNENMTEYQQAKCFYEASKLSRVKQGIKELVATTKLNNIPTIILHGRNDSLIAPNHSSRPYYANAVLNSKSLIEKNKKLKSNVRYYEIDNAQHFDAFISLPQFSSDFVPLHYYFEQSLDLMLDYLLIQTNLPESQVVKAKPKGYLENNILERSNLPPIEIDSKYPIELMTYKKWVTMNIPD